MNTFLPLLFSLILLSCGSHQDNKENISKAVVSEEKTTTPEVEVQNTMPIGEIQKNDLLKPPHSSWFKPNFEDYEPNPEAMKTIKTHLPEYEVKIFMGTWCPDSKREVPEFYKILELANYDMKKVTMYGMDRQKTTPANIQEVFDIHRVPTIIFFKDGEEINRFVEYPQETLEQDLAKIMSGKGYQHSYLN